MALSVHAARKVFHGGGADERIALDDLSFGLGEGSFAVVIGSNGSGKSTLLNVIAGQLALDSGSIEIGGRRVTDWPQHRRAALVARVMQDPMLGTFPTLSVAENLALAQMRARGRGLAPALNARRREHYARLLAGYSLGLESRLDARVGLLSGGQRQVLALAMAVIESPRLLLLDEHTAALDPRTADLVMQATLRAVADARLTTLMVTHNMQHAIRYGDRLLMMDSGRLRLDLAGPAKAGLTVEALVDRFRLADDKMLLG